MLKLSVSLKRQKMMNNIKLKFHTDLIKGKRKIAKVIEQKIAKLQERYDEILMIDINMDTGEKNETPYNVKSTVLLKTKLKDFVGVKIDKNPLLSLRKAFEASEIQLKKYLDKLTHKWEKHLSK